VDNATDGFDLHHLDSGAYIRTMSTGKPIWRLPKQVAFAEESKIVVGGSDHGAVYVFDARLGLQSEVLRHSDGGLVQTIAVSSFIDGYLVLKTRKTYGGTGFSVIAAASSNRTGDISISLWVRGTRQRSGESGPDDQPMRLKAIAFLQGLLQIALIMGTLCYLHEKINAVSTLRLATVSSS